MYQWDETSTIDLSRIPLPAAIELLSYDQLLDGFKTRFLQYWESARVSDPTLPAYDVGSLETDPAMIVGQAFAYLRTLDRSRVNDAVRAVLAPLSAGTDLDNIAAGRNIERLVVVPANPQTGAPAILEGDAALLRRYLLSFAKPAAGTRDRYLLEAWTVWPQSDDKLHGLLDARVNGHAVHGRRGDTDVVIIGPGGRLPTEGERAAIQGVVSAPHVKPEAVSVAVRAATQRFYSAQLVLELPSGPDPDLVRAEAADRVRKTGHARMIVGGEVPEGLIAGAAYGTSVIKVRDLAPVVIEPDPYTVPILNGINIAIEVR
jgi:phage-related baseplate assembly protein